MRSKVAGTSLVLSVLLPSCLKRDEFPPEPVIAFKSFEQFQNPTPGLSDSASLTISFTDGDGDVGLDASDDQPPFDTGSEYYHNLFVDMDRMTNGAWVPFEFDDDVKPYYRIPRITPTGQNKALEGEIAIALKPWPYVVDTVRFHVRMFDRALHESNTVTSGAFVAQN